MKSKALKNRIFMCAALAAAALCAFFAPQSASAWATPPSPPPVVPGVGGAGIYPVAATPVEVESAVLTYDIADFPQSAAMGGYNSTITTEYTLHNPTAEDITVKMLYPFGGLPGYTEDGEGVPFDDISLLSVAADGAAQEYSLRLSYSSSNMHYDFDFESEREGLYDAPLENAFGITPQTAVYEYRIDVNDGDAVRITYTDFDGCAITDGGAGTFKGVTEMNFTDDGFVVFAGGVPSDIRFVYCRDVYDAEHGVIDDSGEGEEFFPQPVEEGSFSQLIAQYVPNWLAGVDQTDWFNFVLAVYGQYNIVHPVEIKNDAFSYAMRWLEYELTIPAGGRTETSVTAPVYPDINIDTDPYNYTYAYFFTPYGGWADFGALTVRINYGGYILQSSAGDVFEAAEGGYTATFDGLAEGAKDFTLCSVPDPAPAPEPEPEPWPEGPARAVAAVLVVAIVVLPVLFFVAGLVTTIALVRRDRRRFLNEKNQNKK